MDISNAAVKRVRAQSRQLGIASRVNGGQHDLARSFPDGHCDLISAQYLHTPFALDRVRVLRTAAHAHPTT